VGGYNRYCGYELIVVAQKVRAIRRKCQRDRAKAIAKKRFLKRKLSKRVSGILSKFPLIGKVIEEFVLSIIHI